MAIRFPLLSLLSVIVLGFFIFQGGDIELYSLELGFSATPDGVRMTIDPAWVVWSDTMYRQDDLGESFGNVAVIKRSIRNTVYGEWVKRFEINHIIQHRALGWWHYAAKLVMPLDPMYYQPKHWDDPTEADRVEWLPPDDWVDVWHFLSFSVHFQ